MKALLFFWGVLFLSSPLLADKVIFAGSEDLKEFDKLIEKNRMAEPPRSSPKEPTPQKPSSPKLKDDRSPHEKPGGHEEHKGRRGIEHEDPRHDFEKEHRQGPPRPEAEEKRKQRPFKEDRERAPRPDDHKGPRD